MTRRDETPDDRPAGDTPADAPPGYVYDPDLGETPETTDPDMEARPCKHRDEIR